MEVSLAEGNVFQLWKIILVSVCVATCWREHGIEFWAIYVNNN